MNNIESLMSATLEKLQKLIDVNNVIGKPIVSCDNAIIIPISKVTAGFVTGGGEYSETAPKTKFNELPHAGGSGGGVNITPLGFLVCYAGRQTLIKIDKDMGDNKWAELIQAGMNILKKEEK